VKHVVFVFDIPAEPSPITGPGIQAEASLGLAAQVPRPIGSGHDFNVGGPDARALIEFVLNAGVRDLDLIVNVG
jgi:hypothetical protein